MNSKIFEENGYGQSSCTNSVFHILQEVGAELKVFIDGQDI